MSKPIEQTATNSVLQKIRLTPYRDFISIVVVMLAADFAPPFLRILGSRAWISLGITEGQWSIFMAARGLFFIIFILAAGVTGDLFGRRRVLLLALVAFISCVPILIFNSPLSSPFVIAYTVWTIIGVMIRTLCITFVILKFEGHQRILALVIYSILAGVSFLLSPILASTLKMSVSFNAVFIAPVLLAVIGFGLVKKYISESRISDDFWRLDALALAVWTFGFCLLIFAGLLSGGLGWTSPLVLAGFGIGGALILTMSWLSGRPLPEKWRFKLRYDRRLGIAIFAGVILNLALYAIAVQVFNFMSRVQNISPILSGIALAPIVAGALLSVQVVGMTSRWQMSQVMAAGLVVIGLSAMVLSFLQPDISYLVLLLCLLLLGFGFILGNSPRLLLLSASVPRSLAATVQSIGSATAHLGSALAYSFMMTLLEGFGMRAYLQTLESFGFNELQIAIRLTTLARASEEISIVAPSEEQAQFLQVIDHWIVRAYTIGLSQAMLVLGLVCLFSAAIVFIGLRNYKKSGELEP
jgi:DHA2 family methylenomycin A resistance protein-like MFS transporter